MKAETKENVLYFLTLLSVGAVCLFLGIIFNQHQTTDDVLSLTQDVQIEREKFDAMVQICESYRINNWACVSGEIDPHTEISFSSCKSILETNYAYIFARVE